MNKDGDRKREMHFSWKNINKKRLKRDSSIVRESMGHLNIWDGYLT